MTDLAYFGRKQLIDALQNGYSPIPGFEYARNEWAYLLTNDGAHRGSDEAIRLAGKITGTRRATVSNRTAANLGREKEGSHWTAKKWERFRARLVRETA